MITLFIAFLLNTFSSAQAYPELIRLNYVQCTSCHTNVFGGGLLSPYGKSVRTSLSLYQREDEQKSETGNERKSSFSLNANTFLRYLFIESENYRTQFLMQLDTEGRIETKSGYAVTSIVGLVPERVKSRSNAPTGVLGKSFILRRLLVEKSFNEGSKKIAIGRDILPRGTNTEDHTTYLRSYSRAGVTDTPTQLRFETSNETTSTQTGFFAPSFEENSNAREWGGYTRFEEDLSKDFHINTPVAVGAQMIAGQTTDYQRISPEIFSRFAFTESTGLLLDLQYTHRKQRETSETFPQWVSYISPFYTPTEWSMFRYRAEKLNRGSPYSENNFKHSLSLLLKPISECSIITSVEREKNKSSWGTTTYTIQLFSQL